MEICFARKTSAWAEDRVWQPSQKTSIDKNGCLKLRHLVADTPELVGWLLSFGNGVRVIRPDSLRQQVLSAVEKIVGQE